MDYSVQKFKKKKKNPWVLKYRETCKIEANKSLLKTLQRSSELNLVLTKFQFFEDKLRFRFTSIPVCLTVLVKFNKLLIAT